MKKTKKAKKDFLVPAGKNFGRLMVSFILSAAMVTLPLMSVFASTGDGDLTAGTNDQAGIAPVPSSDVPVDSGVPGDSDGPADTGDVPGSDNQDGGSTDTGDVPGGDNQDGGSTDTGDVPGGDNQDGGSTDTGDVPGGDSQNDDNATTESAIIVTIPTPKIVVTVPTPVSEVSFDTVLVVTPPAVTPPQPPVVTTPYAVSGPGEGTGGGTDGEAELALAPLPEDGLAVVTSGASINEPEESVSEGDAQPASVIITDESSPLAAPPTQKWALLNLIMAILTVIIMIAMFVTYVAKRKDHEYHSEYVAVKKHIGFRLVTAAAAIAAIALFAATEDIKAQVAYVDGWTIPQTLILLIAVVFGALSRKEYVAKDTGAA